MDIGFVLRRPFGNLTENDADRPALSLEDEQTWTYRELRDRANRYANGLRELGVVSGDRVGLLLYNSLDYWALYFAITRLSAIAVRLNWRLTAHELRFALDDSEGSFVCAHAALAGDLPRGDDRRWIVFPYEETRAGDDVLDGLSLLQADATEPALPLPQDDTFAMIMYTSGTTGRPKGAVWTHGTTMWFAAMQLIQFGYDRSTVTMTTGPFYHVSAFEDVAFPTLLAGGHAIVSRSRNFSLERTLAQIERRRVNDIVLYPIMIYEMLRLPELTTDLSSLKRMLTGGSSIMPWAVRRVRELLPTVEFLPAYGSTEGGPISTISSLSDLEQHPSAVGKPFALTEVRIVRDDGTETERGEDGEVWVKSPSTAREYWRRPAETAQTFVEGWCRTGDQGHLKPDGVLELTGRKKDMILSGSENIYPAEIELALTEHDDIDEAAVVGVPDVRYQEVPAAVIVRRGGSVLSEDDVIVYARTKLARYKCPRYVIFVDELPRNASGKVLKFELRERYAALGKSEGSDLNPAAAL